MPRSPELYIAMLGIIRIGAIAGPLFEAFMEEAVKDRLLDSGAKAVVTTPELLDRIPVKELPELQHVIVVGADETAEDHQFYIKRSWRNLINIPLNGLTAKMVCC